MVLLAASVGTAGCGGTSVPRRDVATRSSTNGPERATARAGSAGADLRGRSAGVALLTRVIHAYESVPAVLVSAELGGAPAKFTIILSHGITVAEQFVGGHGSHATKLVARCIPRPMRRSLVPPAGGSWPRQIPRL